MSRAKPRIAIVSQARTTSSRLPGKVLLCAGKKTVLQHHLDRLRQSDLPVILATSTNAEDDVLEHLANALGLSCVRGDEEDVLSRYALARSEYNLDVLVRVTSDCPLIDGKIIAEAVNNYVKRNDPWLYSSNMVERSFPRGFDFEIFSNTLLDYTLHSIINHDDREHVTLFIRKNEEKKVQFDHIKLKRDKSAYRITLDTGEDWELIKRLINDYDADKLSHEKIIALLDANPELSAINAHVEQKKVARKSY